MDPTLARTHTQAEANPAVQKQIQEHIPILQDFVLTILDRLKATIDEVSMHSVHC